MRHDSRRFLALVFLLVAALFASTGVVGMNRAREVRRETQELATSTIERVALAARMRRTIDRERLLVDAHVFQRDADEMASLEARIAATQADFVAATHAYDRLVTNGPVEQASWRALRDEIVATEAAVSQVLALSRENRDAQVRPAIAALDDRFAAIDANLTALVRLGRAENASALQRMASLQQSEAVLLGVLAALGIVLTAIVGVWVTRVVQAREAQAARHAEDLETRNRDLDAFAGRVAHDLRGPLTTVALAASRLSKCGQTEEGTVALLQRGIARMEQLIGDLLAFSRVGAQASGGVCDPALVALQVQEDFAERLEREGATLRAEVAPAAVRCREALLRQVAWNLLDNAIKYRRPGQAPAVALEGRVAGAMYELRVSDNGSGMTPEEVLQVFAPFYRAPRARDTAGTGLGLSIVKRVVEASGGSVAVESQVGRGTTFVVVLPRATEDAPGAGGA